MALTTAIARKLWKDAPADDDVLNMYLSAASDAVSAYQYDQGAVSSDTYDMAVTFQARNIWNSSKASAGTGDFDGSGYGLTSAPLDWQVKNLLRPQRGIGAIA